MSERGGSNIYSEEQAVRTLILGAGGHAHVVADILLRVHKMGSHFKPIGFLDDDPARVGTIMMGLPVLGTITRLGDFDHDAIIVAIGDNHSRARIFELVRGRGDKIVNAIHPAAVLAPDVRLGEGVMICAGVVVNTGTVIGSDVILNTGCTVDHHCQIGSHAHVAPGVHLGGDVRVSEGASIGIGATIIPGRSVGEWAVVSAGAVVIKNIPAYTTAVGVPARVVRKHRPER